MEPQRTGRRIVLASTSPYRRELLERLGLRFEAAAPEGVDERAVLEAGLAPELAVRRLAADKARSLAGRFPDALLIGADQIALAPVGEGETPRVLGKPGTIDSAIEQLLALQGREHRLLTAVAVCDARTGRVEDALCAHRLCMRPLARAAIERYVRRDMPLDCAGSYKIERGGIALMRSVRGDDFTAIVGLPLIHLVALLARFGVELP